MSIVILEHPRPRSPEKYETVVNTPLSACLMTGYIASTLMSRNHDVTVVDANLYEWSFDKTVKELGKKSYKLLGVHLVYLWEYSSDILDALSRIKKSNPDIHINLYGHFPTFAFEDLLTEYSFIDSVTIGEPEETFLELADAVLNNRPNSALSTIDGLAFNASNSRRDGTDSKDVIVRNSPRKPAPNLDTLPSPFRNDYEQKKKRGISTYILASRGCYGKCTFCYLDNFYGDESQWRGRSPENILNEIADIYEKHGERYFYFADANFFGPGRKGKERARELARLIVDNGIDIKFGIECRVNDVEEESIGALVMAGLVDVFLGVESGSQQSLNRFRKYTTVEESKSAIYTLRKYGIEPNYGFIMFEPDSTLADVRANFEFLKEMEMLNIPSITAHLLHHKQTIFQGTFDYKIKSNSSGTDSEIMYECEYKFKEKSVEALSEDINTFCLQSLIEILVHRDGKNMDSDSCSYDETDQFSRQMNEKLIKHFETALSHYERELICT